MYPKRILETIVLSALFSMPFIVFIVNYSLFFPFVVGKNLVFRALVELMFFAWLALAALYKEYRPRYSPVLLAVAVFVGVVFVADVFGVNPSRSLWSNFERMEGFITLLHLLVYVLIAAVMFTRTHIALWFWRFELAVASGVAGHACLQFLTTEKDRLDSTLGNPIYLAVYALFHIFITLVLMVRSGALRWEQFFYVAVLPLQFWVLFMTATRGATLGVLGGLLIASVGILIHIRHQRAARTLAASLITLLILGIGSFVSLKDTEFVREHPVLKRFASISLSEGTVFARTVVWDMAWQGVKERPLLGWGQENFNAVFNKHYDPRMYAQEPWFDRTHNVVFDWLIAAGVLGLLAYSSIFVAVLWMLYHTQRFTIPQKWLVVGLLAAYGFHNLTVFDQISSYVLFFSVLAWIIAVARDVHGRELWFSSTVFRWPWVISGAALLIGVVVVYLVHAKPLQASQLLLSGLQDATRAQSVGAAGREVEANALARIGLVKLQRAAALGTYGTQEVYESQAQLATRIVAAPWAEDVVRQNWYLASIEGLEYIAEHSPHDARFAVFAAQVHGAYGNTDAQKDSLLTAHAISPRKQSVLIELAAHELRAGDSEAATSLLRKAYELEPAYPTAGIVYATRLIVDEKIGMFDTTFGETTYLGADMAFMSLLVGKEDHDRAAVVWERAFRAGHKRATFLLPGIYLERGDNKRARASTEILIASEEILDDDGLRILQKVREELAI